VLVKILTLTRPSQTISITNQNPVDFFIPFTGISGNFSCTIVLKVEGAQCRIFGAGILNHKNQLNLRVDTVHQAPHTKGETLVKAIVTDEAQFDFAGMIKIEKQAQHSVDFLRQDSLILSEEASANAVPSLEIEANEVRASHAATAAPLSPEQLFYLRSRGIARNKAERMLAEAFLAEATQGVDSKYQRQIIAALT